MDAKNTSSTVSSEKMENSTPKASIHASEAIDLSKARAQIQNRKDPELKDGDGGEDRPKVLQIIVDVADNGYVVNTLFDDDDAAFEVFKTSEEMLNSIKKSL